MLRIFIETKSLQSLFWASRAYSKFPWYDDSGKYLTRPRSLSGETKYIDNNIVVLEWIFFTEVTIILRIPKAACTHVESTVTLLQNDHVGCKLQILIDLLQQFDNHFTGIVAPFLCLLWIIISWLESFEDLIVDLLLNCWSHFLKGYLLCFCGGLSSWDCVTFVFLY